MTLSMIKKLEKRLKHPLPGVTSHEIMRPSTINGNKLRFKESIDPKPGAVLILFYQNGNEVFFPLIQRPVYQGVHSGQMALPGGKKETVDHSLYDTALRESMEEIGIIPDRVQVLGALSSFLVAASNHMVLPVVGFYPEMPVFIPDHVEVDEVIPVRLNDLMDDSRIKRTIIEVRDAIQLDSPYFDLNGKVVWGATAGILSELKVLLKEIGG